MRDVHHTSDSTIGYKPASFPLKTSMNIVIIGAGVAGLAIGWRLVQRGAQVTILERSQPGSGATGASAGMIAVTAETLESTHEEREFAKYSNAIWPDFARELEDISGRSFGYSRSGALILAEDVLALARLERHGAVVDAAKVRELAPLLTGELAGGLWAPDEAHVDSRALALGLAAAFQKAGGKLAANESVVRIERRPAQDGGERAAIAHTPFGHYHADLFVLAAGAWSSLIEADLAPVVPVKGQMVAMMPPPGLALPGPVVWGQGVYAVPRGPHLLIGATIEQAGFDTKPTGEGLETLLAAGARLIPGLRDWTLVDHWAGLRPGSPDGLPLLGPTRLKDLWLAAGQYRNGILFAPAIADLLSDQIMGRSAGIAAFDPRRIAA
jgi:glycine oxidase